MTSVTLFEKISFFSLLFIIVISLQLIIYILYKNLNQFEYKSLKYKSFFNQLLDVFNLEFINDKSLDITSAIYLKSPHKNRIDLIFSSTDYPISNNWTIKYNEGDWFIGECYKNRKMICGNNELIHKYIKNLNAKYKKEEFLNLYKNVKTINCIPIVVEDKFIGALEILSLDKDISDILINPKTNSITIQIADFIGGIVFYVFSRQSNFIQNSSQSFQIYKKYSLRTKRIIEEIYNKSKPLGRNLIIQALEDDWSEEDEEFGGE